MKICIIVLILLFSFINAEAGSLTYNWTAVTTDTDGNTLVSDGLTITNYSLYCGATAGNENSTPVYSGLALSYTITGVLSEASLYCYCTATASNGITSDHSNELKKTFHAKPSSPTES
jgi:hypothetical protein